MDGRAAGATVGVAMAPII